MENQITLNDLALVVTIVDVCSQRGAFKGDELAAVGNLRQKFAELVKASQPQQPAAETKEPTESAE
jgi:hypothetical protein